MLWNLRESTVGLKGLSLTIVRKLCPRRPFLVTFGGSPIRRCFVPMKDTQATMTGSTWPHFSCFWPFVVAGALGRADAFSFPESDTGTQEVAPASSALAPRTPRSDSGTDEDGSDASQTAEAADAPNELRDLGGTLPGPDSFDSNRYKDVFGAMPLHDSMLEMF